MIRFTTLTDTQIRRVLEAVDGYNCDQYRRLMLRALFALLANLGMRVSEALNLRWSDIDLEAGEVVVTRLKRKKYNKQGKRNKPKRDTLPLDSRTIVALTEWKRASNGGRRPFPLTRHIAYNIWRRLEKRAGLRPKKLHALRHSAVTRWVKTGDLAFAMHMAGHDSLHTTSLYTHCDSLKERFRGVEHV